ncbi:Acyl transferase/acyl hydrolase/lysophospholipase [Penicillium malachiteum]|uniref:Acyl transferase/acyl hydrolase/lysophospholipase n=1 Tax=Penicillium malachiteum TaxID=1324776 RepID=A0AAD6HNQ8_9EURO|nr:Acyl transferase/acyl hydrolase/lysophospholipase [Penicillium malachiteum]
MPTLQILGVNTNEDDMSSLWLQGGGKQARFAYGLYHLASPSATSVAGLKFIYESKPNTELQLLDFAKGRLGLPNNHGLYDLLVFKVAAEKNSITSVGSSVTSVDSVDEDSSVMGKWTRPRKPEGLSNFGRVLQIASEPGRHGGVHLWRPLANIIESSGPHKKQLVIVRFHDDSPTLSSTLKALLKSSSWAIRTVPLTKLAAEEDNDSASQSTVMVLDELCNQTSKVSDSDNALVQGLFRVIRLEDPQANLTTLDVQSAGSPATSEAIYLLLQRILDGTHGETEYAERDSILLLQRLVPDCVVNDFKAAEGGKKSGAVVMSSYETIAQVRLQAEKVGTLQSLTWCETAVGEVPMEPGMVEIEFMVLMQMREIRRETNGRGVDVILNSLTGELLDESWRLTTDGGIMVEIGKRDIVNRNSLAMEPFDRNCSFRAVDLSYTREITNKLIGDLLSGILDLVNGGHVGPIHPITHFAFEEVIAALSYVRNGKHMSKIVISGPSEGTEFPLPIRPAIPTLQLDHIAAYLIVGGLRGLCGSLAVDLARHGARYIISIGQRGIQDPASARVHANCSAYGCNIVEAKGDVGDLDFVRQIFRSIQPRRVAGLIHGAMALGVAGTWNLHLAAQSEQAQPLNFFTMLSNIIGNKGQANYAAGNALLDAFASYRNASGLRANNINLGLIEDVGYVAKQGGALEVRFDRSQWFPINECTLRRMPSYSILEQQQSIRSSLNSAQLITGLAYPLTVNNSAELKEGARFGFYFNNHSTGSGGMNDYNGGKNDPTAGAIKALRLLHESQADVAAINKAVLGLLQMQLIKILRLETEMEPGKPLMAYGLDSVSAVELRGWVRQKTGAELSTLVS